MKHQLLLAIAFLFICGCQSTPVQEDKVPIKKIKIDWKMKVDGDFSFTEKWEYPEGIVRNQFGQLVGNDSLFVWSNVLRDEAGKLLASSFDQYYSRYDTTHQFHTMSSETNVYNDEHFPPRSIGIKQLHDSTYLAIAEHPLSMQPQLTIAFDDKYCQAWLSIGMEKYRALEGNIEMDRVVWYKGIGKGKFNFVFENPSEPDKPIYWKGKFCARVHKLWIQNCTPDIVLK